MKNILYALCFCVAISQVFSQTAYQWQKSGSLILARQRFNVALLPNNEVLIMGGMLQNGTITNTTEIYNPITRQTRQGTPMNQPHGECDVITRSDGTIIVVGGIYDYSIEQVTKAVELYNPATQEWTVIGFLLHGRRQHCALALNHDEILVAGGFGSKLTQLNSAEIFTISKGTSRSVGNLPIYVNNARMVRSKDSTIILFGGRSAGAGSSQSNNVFSFNTATQTWKSVGTIPRTTAFPAITTLHDGRIVSMGGKHEPDLSFLKQVFIENQNTFTTLATMKSERHLGYIHQLTSSILLAFGGRNNAGTNMASGEFIDIETNQVTTASPMNEAHTEGCSIEIPIRSNNVIIGKSIFVLSGIGNNGQFVTSIESMISSANSIGGIINIYTPVTSIGGECTATITVGNAKGFSVGDKVLIMQMQGAEIASNNLMSYGEVLHYGFTGNHEFARIADIQADSILLEHGLLYSYDIRKKVQLIRVPEYTSVYVNAPLTCKAWDGETGGVLALEVKDTLTVNAPLSVTGKGFRGGLAISSKLFPIYYVTDYIIDAKETGYAAAKGEGIAEYGIAPMTRGKGSAANGGGGGGNHNAGGGGGANYGKGGFGGYGWYSPDYTGDNMEAQGLGGKPIDYADFLRPHTPLIMGGGGGAGHTNQSSLGHGGAGGGIMIVKAGHIVPNGQLFAADGAPGKDGKEDGAGGGGGGGTIYLDIQSINDTIVCSAQGGKGGDINLDVYASPPGGGGGGGYIVATYRTSRSLIHTTVSGGIAGISIKQNDNYGSSKGSDGFFDQSNIIHESQTTPGKDGNRTSLPNSYYKVNSIFPDLGGVQLGSYDGLCPDDKVLIIQMQGAFVNTDNTADYGKIQSLVFSGNYEFARIASITSIGIIFKNKLKNFYSPADGNVQLIRVPEYRNLTINSPLSCQAWNGETGGVLVFSVENTLQLNSFIDVTGKGFRGGAASNAVNNTTLHTGDYVSAVDSTRFSRKGEGIFGWRNPDHRAGRGAAASGGGGGNNHNAGGGGGSYLGCGGMGGFGWDTYPGDRTITQGMGGYPIQLIGNKIFMGGGGGAGHSNEFTGTAGAAGGGIVIIQAKEIISNNQSIIAKGADGKNAPFDGTGGGGAGGTILLDCRRFVNRLELDVRGGSGGSTTEHRDGPGGGGGGGLIGFTAPETPTDVIPLVNGGGSGTNRDLNKDGATNGCPGAVLHTIALPGDITIIATMEESQADDSKSALPYPHPASETVHLSVISNEPITVSDVLGTVLDIPITRHSQGISIDVSMIHAGNYYIRVGNTYYSCVVIH
ncbi:MAG: Kelch repeat-containing protein [Candidatus Kapaibacterium sp.]|jgi:hypothetical protein